jgi:hypothetical protein
MKIDYGHLKKAKVSYVIHACRVVNVSLKLIILSFIGIIHAIFPMLFTETVSNGIKKIASDMSHF